MAKTVGDFVWQRLREWGVGRVFGYPGDGINGLVGALDRAQNKPELVQVRDEEMAAFMMTAPPGIRHDAAASLPRRGRQASRRGATFKCFATPARR